VSLQIEGVVEAFAAERAEVALRVAVTLHVAVEQPLQGEHLGAEPALELGWIVLRPGRGELLQTRGLNGVIGQRVLDAIASVDDLQRGVWRQAELKKIKLDYTFRFRHANLQRFLL
jgi:hypothetical protein